MRRWGAGLAMVAVCASAGAQRPTAWGMITGSVIDPQYMAVEGATVTVQPGGLSTTTGSAGQFAFSTVPVGDCSVTVHARGYKERTIVIRIKANESVSVPVTLVDER